MSADSSTSRRDSDSGLPCSSVMIRAIASARSRSNAVARTMTVKRASGVLAAQSACARCAAAAATSTSSSPASGTSPSDSPVAGSTSGAVPADADSNHAPSMYRRGAGYAAPGAAAGGADVDSGCMLVVDALCRVVS